MTPTPAGLGSTLHVAPAGNICSAGPGLAGVPCAAQSQCCWGIPQAVQCGQAIQNGIPSGRSGIHVMCNVGSRSTRATSILKEGEVERNGIQEEKGSVGRIWPVYCPTSLILPMGPDKFDT